MTRQLKAIVRRMVKRGQKAVDAPIVHEAWIRTQEGSEEAALLAAVYGDLDPDIQEWIAETAARTGADSAVPLVSAALQDKSCPAGVLTGVWYAARFGADSNYKKTLAPLLVRWAKPDATAASNLAISALPKFDSDLAAGTLLVSEFLECDPAIAMHVVSAFTDAGHAVPLETIRRLFARLESIEADIEEHLDTTNLKTCLSALAYHEPEEATARADILIAKWPGLSDSLSSVFLHAAGLADLYDVLCDYADAPELFSSLPHPARLYFAATYFLADWNNGGLGQAFGNSTGDYARLAREGFEAAGDTRLTSLLDRAFTLFGPTGPPADRTERVRQMEVMKPNFWEQTEAWDDEHFRLWDKPSSSYLLARYAAKHSDVLRALLEE